MFPAFQASPAPVALKTGTLKAGTTVSPFFVNVAEKFVVCRSTLADRCDAKILADSFANSSNFNLFLSFSISLLSCDA